MPSSAELPTLPELLNAFHAAVGSERKTEDSHLGSLYDRMAGVGALCMRTLAERDQGEARAIFFDSAADDRLDDYTELRFGAVRVQDTHGTGQATLRRDSGPSGTIPKGTRILVRRSAGDAASYWTISADISVASEISVTVPVVAEAIGPDGQISVDEGDVTTLRIDDPLWSDTAHPWAVVSLDCGPGTTRQRDPEYRAAIRQGRKDQRPGFPTAIIKAMTDAGASVVALYQSDYLGDAADFGLNRIYVGDSGYESPASLLTACRLAVPKVCVAGTAVQILPMTSIELFPVVTVRLWNSPERLNQVQAQSDAAAAVLGYFARRDNAFLWSTAAIRSAVMGAIRNVHSIDVLMLKIFDPGGGFQPIKILALEPDPLTLFDTSPLTRYSVADRSVTVTMVGPGG